MHQQPNTGTDYDNQQTPGSPSGRREFAEALMSARRSEEALGWLLDEFRESLRELADDGLQSDLRPKVGASDLVQQTLIEATTGFPDFRGETREQLTAWLHQILARNLLNEFRKWRSTKMRAVRREVPLNESGTPLLASTEKSPSSILSRREHQLILHKALERLSPDQQEVIRLRHFEQLGFGEIARRMNRQYSAARMLWYRAFEKLMHELGELRDEPI